MLIVDKFPAYKKLLAVNFSKDVMLGFAVILPVISMVSRPNIKPPKINAKIGNIAMTKTYFHFLRQQFLGYMLLLFLYLFH